MAAKKRYLALVDLEFPTNPDAPRDEWTMRRVRAGKTTDSIPAQSLGWLVEQGLIEAVTAQRQRRTED
jgi:hypothetical protein